MKKFSFIFFILFSLHSYSQTRIIKGKVVYQGEPLPGVSIKEKSTTNESLTQAKGNFSLEITDKENVTLVFSYTGPYKERVVNRKDTFIFVNYMPEKRFYHYIYGLGGISVLKSNMIDKYNYGSNFSIGYIYNYYKIGIGTEINLCPNINPNEKGNYYQIGFPIYSYVPLRFNFTIYLGASYNLTLSDDPYPNDLKITTGIIYNIYRWGFDLRYNHGLVNTFDNIKSLNQSLNFGIRYYICL